MRSSGTLAVRRQLTKAPTRADVQSSQSDRSSHSSAFEVAELRDDGRSSVRVDTLRSTRRGPVFGSPAPKRKQPQQTAGLGSMVARRVPIGMAVIAWHGLLVAALVATFVGHPGLLPGPSATMVLLRTPDERLPPRPRPAPPPVHIQPVPPHFEMTALTPIPAPVEAVGAALNASQAGSPPFERLIPEAQAQNPNSLREFCGRLAHLESEGPTDSRTVVLMIRVEPDGRVSDSKVEQSSGSAHLDEVAQTCVSEAGVYEPRHAGTAAIASWQRIHWIW